MKVLLVYPNANRGLSAYADIGALAEPIALEYVGAAAASEGHEVRLLDLRLHPELEETLADYRPDVVGVTGYSLHVSRALEVCRVARERVPGCRTVAGGHHATLEPVDFQVPEVDFVVIGEGTGPFKEILRALAAGGEAPPIPGVWSRAGGAWRDGGPPAPFDIDAIAPPDRGLVRADRPRYFIDWMQPIALLRTSVGCPYRCSFCSLWRIMGGRHHKREVGAVVEELAATPERYVFFIDDSPFANPRRMRALAEAIAAAGIEKEYFSYCRIGSLVRDPGLIARWKEVGLRRLLIGVETIFADELKDYDKRQERDEIVAGLRSARELGVSLYCNFIIHPQYTAERFDEVARFIEEHDVECPSFTIWTPLPGTGDPLDQVILRRPDGRPNWDYFDLQHPVTETRLPQGEFMRRFNELYRIFADKYVQAKNPLHVRFLEEKHREIAAHALGEARRDRTPRVP